MRMPMIAKIVQTAKQRVKAIVDIHNALAGWPADMDCVFLITDMASPGPDKVVPIHRWGLKTKSRWSGHACTKVRGLPDQRLCCGRPSLDTEFVASWPAKNKARTVPVAGSYCL